jgi:SAM-dependent methyltransferase
VAVQPDAALGELVLDPAGSLLYDNPQLYRAMFPEPDSETARFIRALLDRFAVAGAGTRVLDVGCGLGREVAFLAAHGFQATGLEREPRMVEQARTSFPELRFVEASMADFDLGERFDAITCMGSAFLYNLTNAEIAATVTAFRRHLEHGGLLLLDIRNGAYFLDRGCWHYLDSDHPTKFTVGDQVFHATGHYQLDVADQILRRTRAWDVPGRTEPLVQQSAFRLLFPQELRYFLDQAAFRVEAMFDSPGPSADEPWLHDSQPLSSTVTGERLHVVARAV